MSDLATRPALGRGSWPGEAAIAAALGRRPTGAMLADLADFLAIHGEWLTAGQAARRLGRSTRTIERYRATLKDAREIAAGWPPEETR
jgi:hypothetical protein